MIHSKNIVLKNHRGVNSIYRCEFRDEGQIDYSVLMTRNASYGLFTFILSAEDRQLGSEGRHEVYAGPSNLLEYYSSVPAESGEVLTDSVKSLKSAECRIYSPVNRIGEDFLIIVSATVNGNPVQLYGGLHSECEVNSYEVIRDNHNSYSEYVSFHVPLEIVENQPFTCITIDAVPYQDLKNGVYILSETYVPDSVSFLSRLQISLRAETTVNSDGVFGVEVATDTTVKEFESYYKYIYRDESVSESRKDTYSCKIRLYDDAQNPGSDRLVCEWTDPDWIQNNGPDDPLIQIFVPFNRFLSGDRYLNCEFSETDERLEGTYDFTWDRFPETLLGLVTVEYECSNVRGDKQTLTFYSNYFFLTRDDCKYLIDRPAITSLWKEFPEDFQKYVQDYMINVNITSELQIPESQETRVIGQPVQMIYKPLFFKAGTLDSLNIITGISQRIGLNLQDYETKVSAFKLRIGNKTFTETERTEIYVIFKINASTLDTTQSRFHILDQDSEYIASGNLTFSS